MAGPLVSLSPRRTTYALGLVILALMVVHIVVMWLYFTYWITGEYGWTADQYRHFATVFNLNEEANPATWFSSFLLLACSGLLGFIAIDKRGKRDRYAWHWVLLTVVFLLLSIDEGSRLHERAILPLRAALNLGGFFYYSWVLLGIPAVLLFVALYVRFFFHLPRGTQILFFLAGALFVSGAIGIEMIEGYYDQLQGGHGEPDMTFMIFVMVEEGAEMFGALIFLHALMLYVRSHVGEISFGFAGGSASKALEASPRPE